MSVLPVRLGGVALTEPLGSVARGWDLRGCTKQGPMAEWGWRLDTQITRWEEQGMKARNWVENKNK